MGEVEVFGGDVGVDGVEVVDESSDDYDVLEDVVARLESRALEAVSTNQE